MKTAFIYSDDLVKFDYGPAHPLKIARLRLTYELIRSYGLLSLPDTRIIEARPANDEEILLFHGREYLEVLQVANRGIVPPGAEFFGLGAGDNPLFRGLLDWSRIVTGGSIQAAQVVESGETDIAFNMSGGLHHALASRASGFCYINDPVIAILTLLQKGRKIAYVDIDAHHADGVQEAFYETDQVLTISLHETGKVLFPGTGFPDEMGKGRGKGYAVNIPLPPSSDDEIFEYAFAETVPEILGRYKPDIVVCQLGVDTFLSDPLTHMNLTTGGYSSVVRKIKELSGRLVALGGGGYDTVNVARAWTLAWALMNNTTVPDEIPQDFLKRHASEGFRTGKIRDGAYTVSGLKKEQMRDEIDRTVSFLKEKVFPRIS